ncbi:hypothetical protein KAH27_04300 [bacterium]|nr:hypothetical protein [bacterium]
MSIIKKISLILISFTILCGAVLFLTDGGHYLFALALETKWNKANPKTKQELEKNLYCYYTKIISPSQSLWGRSCNIKPDEKMIQYCIMWDENCSLDVVYNNKNKIKAIYTSYE